MDLPFSQPGFRVRRVVTGHDTQGRSTFVSDAPVQPFEPSLAPGSAFHLLWHADEAPTFPSGDLPPSKLPSFFPPVGGIRFFIASTPPSGEPVLEGDALEAALAEHQANLPGLLGVLEEDGWHRTDTIDMEIVLPGELALTLDDSAETVLTAGDVMILNGGQHRWQVRGTEPAVMAVFMTGAHRT
jgi:hypothetical protein